MYGDTLTETVFAPGSSQSRVPMIIVREIAGQAGVSVSTAFEALDRGEAW
jgi:hypothetical protein